MRHDIQGCRVGSVVSVTAAVDEVSLAALKRVSEDYQVANLELCDSEIKVV